MLMTWPGFDWNRRSQAERLPHRAQSRIKGGGSKHCGSVPVHATTPLTFAEVRTPSCSATMLMPPCFCFCLFCFFFVTRAHISTNRHEGTGFNRVGSRIAPHIRNDDALLPNLEFLMQPGGRIQKRRSLSAAPKPPRDGGWQRVTSRQGGAAERQAAAHIQDDQDISRFNSIGMSHVSDGDAGQPGSRSSGVIAPDSSPCGALHRPPSLSQRVSFLPSPLLPAAWHDELLPPGSFQHHPSHFEASSPSGDTVNPGLSRCPLYRVLFGPLLIL